MGYKDHRLPNILNNYLEEIYANQELNNAFFDCDIEIYGPEWVKDLLDNDEWKEDFLTGGKSNYDIKPFARSGSGGLWVVLNDKMIGYIGTEGECGIIAKNIHEFINIVATCKGCFFRISHIKDEESFIHAYNVDNKDFEYKDIMDQFIKKHHFENDPKKIYKMVKRGLTVKPFFIIKATDDNYVDSYSLLGSDDGQKSLEYFIEHYL